MHSAAESPAHGSLVRVLAGFAAITLLGTGAATWRSEHVLLATYRPVTVTVRESRVERIPELRGESWTALVTYDYRAGGREQVGHRVYPILERGSRDWAQRLAARFPPGASVRGWVDVRRPDESFLLRRPAPSPVMLLVAGLVCLTTAIVLWTRRRARVTLSS